METQEEYKDLATRHNEGKLKWSLVDFKSLEPMVRVLEFGAEKYEVDNWKKGLKVTEVCESLLRHVHALMRGDNEDNESGLPHVGHILVNAMFLSYMIDNKPELDDRLQVELERLKIAIGSIQIDPDLTPGDLAIEFLGLQKDAKLVHEATQKTMGGHHVSNLENNT